MNFYLSLLFFGFKLVICGKYKNLNKIIQIQRISLKFDRLLIFVILYSSQCKNRGICCVKSVLIRKDQREFCAQKSKEMASEMKMHSTRKIP